MNKKRPLSVTFSDIIFTVFLTFILLMSLSHTVVIQFNWTLVFFLIFLCVVMDVLFFRFPLLLIGLLAVVLVFVGAKWVSGGYEGIYTVAGDYFLWIIDYWSYSGSPDNYILVTTVICTFILSMPLYLLIRNNTHSLVIMLIGACVFLGLQWANQQWDAINYSIFELSAFLLIWLMYTIRQSAPKNKQACGVLLTALPGCLLIVAVVLALPVSSNPIGEPVMQWAADKGWINVNSSTGFALFNYNTGATVTDIDSGDTELGGKVNASNQTVLYMTGDKPIYIRGRTAKEYDGRRWKSDQSETYFYEPIRLKEDYPYLNMKELGFNKGLMLYNGAIIDENMLLYSLDSWRIPIMLLLMSGKIEEICPAGWDLNIMRRLIPEGFSVFAQEDTELFRLVETTLQYNKLSTKTVFTPEKTLMIEYERNESFLIKENGDVQSSLALNDGFTYKTAALELNLSVSQFEELCRAELTPQKALNLLQSYGSISNTALLEKNALQVLLAYYESQSRAAYNEYTILPDTVTPRTHELAQYLAAGMTTSYDIAKSIESYLASEYIYDMDMEKTPEGYDFVDYFLFEQKRGYCTYYATAMVVLCRAVGIPARYVEGFKPDNKKTDGRYNVTGEEAHAWPEVYLDGIGWIPFEPTAPYYDDFMSVALNRELVEENAQSSPSPSSTPPLSPTPSQLPSPSPSAASVTGDEEAAPWFGILQRVGIVVLVIIIIGVFLAVRRRFLVKKYLIMLKSFQGIIDLYPFYCKLFGRLGVIKKKCETPIEYGVRVDTTLKLETASMKMCAEIYCMLQYSEKRESVDSLYLPDDGREYCKMLNEIKRSYEKRWGNKLGVFIHKYLYAIP